MSQAISSIGEPAAALLRVASYLSRPQQFVAVADARAELRRTLQMAEKGSVVLTTHGGPEAAVLPFATLQDMRRALMQLLVEHIESSFAEAQQEARRQRERVPAVTERELESLVGAAIRTARRSNKRQARRG